MIDVAPWQVWWVDFDPQMGTEQASRRPAIVVGTRLACDLPNKLVIVVPCTHTNRRLPWQPSVDLSGDVGYAMCDQLKSISILRVKKRHPANEIGDAEERAAIAGALRELVLVDV